MVRVGDNTAQGFGVGAELVGGSSDVGEDGVVGVGAGDLRVGEFVGASFNDGVAEQDFGNVATFGGHVELTADDRR